MFSTIFLVAASALPATRPDAVVVCPDSFRGALAPWVTYREAQGHAIAIVPTAETAEQVRRSIRQASGGGRPRFIVLVGDADPRAASDPALRRRCVPPIMVAARVNVRFGSEREIATDNGYGDFDADQLPDAAVGRLTADSPEELSRIVKKIIAYEKSGGGRWNRQVNIVAGVGGFGTIADAVIETAAKSVITAGVPAQYASTMTYGSWQSPYCPDPRAFHETALDRHNEGCLFWVYIGHGQRRGLDLIRTPRRMYPILSTSHVDGIRAQHGASIALFLACYTCAFDHRLDCLGEELLRSEGAPVAVIGGTRMTMPYAMTTLSSGMLQECLTGRRKTVGEVLMHAKRRMMRDAGDDPVRKMLDSIARTLTPGDTDPADERAEHLHLMNLLGDPMLRIRYPGPVEVQVAPRAIAGESIEITGRASVEGTAAIELVVRRDRLTFEPEPRGVFPAGDDALAAFQAVYNKANDPRLATIDVQVRDGEFAGKLTVPQDVQGRLHVRVLVTGNQGSAAGAADVYVRRATKAR